MILVAIVVAAGFAYYFVLLPSGPCMPLRGAGEHRSKVGSSQFDAVTEYSLPQPSRWSNAITVAQDGSVWFGEQSVPGVGHLYTNGTLVEYPWPSASRPTSTDCGFESSIWGIAIWNGMVWGTSGDQNALVGINPQTGAPRVLNVSGIAPFPYTLSVAPDGSLWFTALDKAATLGRIGTDYNLTALHVNGIGSEYPAQLDFVNSTYAYMVTIDLTNSSGGLYSFDPAGVSTSVTPQRLGASFHLLDPDSVAAVNGTVWLAQHGPSNLAAFDTTTGGWTLFPTTRLTENVTTLPYFVSYGPGGVWFNEHYGNRIGFITTNKQTMTEYSESNPPVTNESDIGNDLTISPSPNGLWFTSTTGNYVGYINASYVPSFSVSVEGADLAAVQRGGRTGLNFTIGGSWSSPLSTVVSDSENYTGTPSLITMTPGVQALPAGSGPVELQLEVSVSSKVAPGEYTIAFTASDGLVLRTAFVFLTVS